LFESSYPSPADIKDVEEAVPKAFGFGIFTGFVFSFFAKSDCAGLDLVPGKGHRSGLIGGKKVVHFIYK